MIRRSVTFLTVLFFIAGAAYAQTPPAQNGANAEAKQAAREAVSEWLELTDAGEFEASYDAASATMKDQVTREQWMQMSSQAEKQVGELQNRQFVQSQYQESIPQLDGSTAVILMYQSTFESGSLREMVVAVEEGDDWKVAGYRLMPPQPQGGAPGQGGPGQGGPGGGR